MFPLFETIRIEHSVPQNLSYHQERVNRAFHDLFAGTRLIPDLAQLIKVPDGLPDSLHKCRFLYNRTEWSTEFSAYIPKKVTTLKLVTVDHINYGHKYTNRKTLDELFSLREGCDDVLIVRNGYLTDSSIANILFSKDSKWYTPALPLLEGTCRARLLDQGIVREDNITLQNFRNYSHFMLINAMNDFDADRISPVYAMKG